MKRGRFVSRLDRLRATGMRSRSSGRNAPIAVVEALAAAGERVAEAAQVRARGVARRLVEHVRELVELDGRRRGLRERDRVAVGEAVVGRAARELDVLEAERRARPDRSASSRSAAARPTSPASAPSRAMLEPSSRRSTSIVSTVPTRVPPIRTSLPRTRLAALGTSRLERVGRHERQALVGVVGEEHGDEDDEHRRRADQHRVAGDRCRGRPSRTAPEQVVEQRLDRARAVAAAGAGAALGAGAGAAGDGRRRGGPAPPVRSRAPAPRRRRARRRARAPSRRVPSPARAGRAPACRGRRAGASPSAGGVRGSSPCSTWAVQARIGSRGPSSAGVVALAPTWRKFAEQPGTGAPCTSRTG